MESFSNRARGAAVSAFNAVKGAMNRKLTEISMKRNTNWGDVEKIYERSASKKVSDLFKPGNRAGSAWAHDTANTRYGETPAYKRFSNHLSGEEKHNLKARASRERVQGGKLGSYVNYRDTALRNRYNF